MSLVELLGVPSWFQLSLAFVHPCGREGWGDLLSRMGFGHNRVSHPLFGLPQENKGENYINLKKMDVNECLLVRMFII
jgi:hypothetical protein